MSTSHPATAFPKVETALLLIDVINPFAFRDGGRFARAWLPTARRIARLRDRCRTRGIPIVYVNDNFGQWRSDFKRMVQLCGREDMPGAPIVDLLAPAADDFFVLKPTLSGFHETPLHLLLTSGNVRHLILAGFAADICVFFTAADAHMRTYAITVPHDGVASERDADRRRALQAMKRLFRARTPSVAALRWRRPAPRR